MNLGAAVPATRVRVRAAQPALASSFMGGKVLSRSADLCELRSAKGAAPAGRQTQEVRVLARSLRRRSGAPHARPALPHTARRLRTSQWF